MSSFKMKYDYIGNKLYNKVEFFAFGWTHTYGMFDFIKAMGLYTRQQMDDADFDTLAVTLPNEIERIQISFGRRYHKRLFSRLASLRLLQ